MVNYVPLHDWEDNVAVKNANTLCIYWKLYEIFRSNIQLKDPKLYISPYMEVSNNLVKGD